MKDLLSIVSHFQLQGTVQEINPLGAGLINDTYKVSTLGLMPQLCIAAYQSCHFPKRRNVAGQYQCRNHSYP